MIKTITEHQKDNFNKEYTDRLLKKYPDKVPIIFLTASNTPLIDKRKFLIPRDLIISQLIYVIRKKINLSPEKALFLHIEKSMPNSNMLVSEAYELYKEKNGILYVTYSSENTFG
jgi:GABA(A) receptor-associated protein